MMKRCFMFSAICALLILPLSAQAGTVFHYEFSDSTNLANVIDQGGAGNNGTGNSGAALSMDIPTAGVPSPAAYGNRSLSGNSAGAASTQGVTTDNLQLLLNADIEAIGGFTFEAWFKWDGTGNINSIIDYAGTDKFRMLNGTDTLDMAFSNNGTRDIAANVSTNEWHYVAMVFDTGGAPITGTTIPGTMTWYFDGNTALGSVAAAKGVFGDSLNRKIGVGTHPNGFSGDNFGGLVYSPRVTLGALSSTELLYVPEPSSITLLIFGSLFGAICFYRKRSLKSAN